MATGATIVGSLLATTTVFEEYASSETLAANDLVNIGSDGELDLAATGERILGVTVEDATSSSTSVSVDITPYQRVIMDNDNTGTAFAATHVGSTFDITGATGAQVIDTSTVADGSAAAAAGQVSCLEYNPQGFGLDDDTSIGMFLLRERQLSTV